MTAIIAIILLGLFALLCVGIAFLDYRDLKHRVEALEQANAQRLPYRAADEILDAIAALVKDEAEQDFHRELIRNAAGHLQNALKVGTKRE